MANRGYNHKSPLGDFPHVEAGRVNVMVSVSDLMSRCNKCFC
jgi:hypothetical protein